MQDATYPIAFLTSAGCLFLKHKTELSRDGTPRYIPNPNADSTYSLSECLKNYQPIYDENEVYSLLIDTIPKT